MPYLSHVQARRMYSALINSFEEYRFVCLIQNVQTIIIDVSMYYNYRCMKHNVRHLSHICDTLDSGNVCPACPQKVRNWRYIHKVTELCTLCCVPYYNYYRMEGKGYLQWMRCLGYHERNQQVSVTDLL